MAGLDFTAQELSTVLQAATPTSIHSSRRYVFHLLTDVAAVVKLASRVRVFSSQRRCALLSRSCSAGVAVTLFALLDSQMEVCATQDQLERVFLQLLQSPLKLMCTPIQVTLAECYVALFQWGDSRKIADAIHNLLKVLGSRADTSCRVYVLAASCCWYGLALILKFLVQRGRICTRRIICKSRL